MKKKASTTPFITHKHQDKYKFDTTYALIRIEQNMFVYK